MNRNSYRMRLSAAIAKANGVPAQWVTATAVHEKIKGRTVWQGDVETFELVGHKETKYCYAWMHDVKEGSQIIMALKTPPVDSAAAAVREYLKTAKPEAK